MHIGLYLLFGVVGKVVEFVGYALILYLGVFEFFFCLLESRRITSSQLLDLFEGVINGYDLGAVVENCLDNSTTASSVTAGVVISRSLLIPGRGSVSVR